MDTKVETICVDNADTKPISRGEPDEQALKDFRAWYGGLIWMDPYPHAHDVAELAWLKARDFYLHEQSNHQHSTNPRRQD
jgi:hypothetical protein